MLKELSAIFVILFYMRPVNAQQASIRFILNDTFQSVKSNFKDSASKALQIEADVLSSQEFKDSLIKHTFSCMNNPFSLCDCVTENNGCNAADRISGLTVYNNLMKDSVVIIR